MHHSATIGDLLTLLFILGGLVFAGIGIAKFLAGSMSEGRDADGKSGCIFFATGAAIIVAAILLAGCATAPQYRDRIVEVDKPVAVQPIKASDVPPLPGQLGKRPPTASQAADAALAGRCDAIAFVLRAYPLLLLSAGLPPAQAPRYPECEKK